MNWSRAYFDMLLRFAMRAAEIEVVSMDTALLRFTPFYLNAGLTHSFAPDDPTW